MGMEARQKRNRLESCRRVREKCGFLAVLLVLSMVFASIPQTVLAGANKEFVSAGTNWMEPSLNFSSEMISSPEGCTRPTGDLIYDVQQVSEEEIPDDVPVYGNFSVFSQAGANGIPFVEEIR